MTRARALAVAAIALAAGALATCTPVQLGDGDRRITARELGDEVVAPTLDDVVATTQALATSVAALAAAPDATLLAAAQTAWRAARAPWKQATAFGFGPATDLRLDVAIDQNPVDFAKVEEEVAGTSPIDDAYVDALGANRKGLHAIEYLLFRAGDDAAVLASLSGPEGARRRELAVAYAQNVARRAGELRAAWTEFAATIADPGTDNAKFPTVKASIDTFVNECVFLAELVADARIGKPSGTATGGTPQPQLEESGPSDHSLADITSTLDGIRNVYFGSRDGVPGKGIGKLVADQSPATDREVRLALTDAYDKVAAIPRPYAQALVDQRPEVTAAHESIKELKRIFSTEVVGVLGATLKFNDNDGD